ncbi:hypothetical protein [Pseudomonas xionganensis]|uniref:Uncharacterized protein n=1 Tax=Pseudomonas xionganensis TaxID=2654845 RepID=A0A6I4KRT9_9PSED|nr:hypothetical protein [Pseudomonas xionganensis]MVW74371.1 hypothetical protein [Pseudomonas xionganensis]
MNALETKIDFIFCASVMVLGGLAGVGYALYLALREFQWGDDAGWGYVVMAIGAGIIAAKGIHNAFQYKSINKI